MKLDQSLLGGYGPRKFRVLEQWADDLSVWKAEHTSMIIYGLVQKKRTTGRMIGFIVFMIYEHPGGKGALALVPYVDLSELHPDFQGQGLGRRLYKSAANDLLKDYSCVRSDSIRSPAAEGVWKSICRANPKKTLWHRSQPYQDDSYFEVRGPGPIRRRPVRVRGHQRKR